MKKYIILFLTLYIFNQSIFAASASIANPQSLMIGARAISLGASPSISGDISSTFINPATLSELNELPFSLTSQQLFGHFNYIVINTGIPQKIIFKQKDEIKSQKVGISVSYAALSLNGIPKVEIYNGDPYQTGSFNAGFNILHVGLATNYYKKLTFDKLAVGAALKTTQQYVGQEKASTFGIDTGMIGTRYINNKYINKIIVSGSIHNLISPSIKFETSGNEALLPTKIYLGAKADLFNDRLALFLNNNEKGVYVGTEYEVDDGLFARGSTNFKSVNFGTGIILKDIPTGIPKYTIKVRIDISYTQNASPMNDDPSYAMSISSLGRSIPKQPEILNPKNKIVLTSEKEVNLNGIGPKNTTIRLYNNNNFFRTTLSNKYGNWKVNSLPIHEGENQIHIQSYNLENDFSIKSSPKTIILDTTPPKLDINIFPESSILNIEILSNEELSKVTGKINNKKIRLKKDKSYKKKSDKGEALTEQIYLNPTKYIGKVELPENLKENTPPPKEMHLLQIFATDQSGNKMETEKKPFFGTITFPQDKHVHYADTLLAIGKSSDAINTIFVNNSPVFIDNESRFSSAVTLEPGKNSITTTFETLNNKALTFSSRVLRLVSYRDMNPKVKGRREIEFLSTIGILHGNDDGNFYPRKSVTRQYLTKIMVLAMDEEVEDTVLYSLFDDVQADHPFAKYIQHGINNGLIFAFPDGTFKPEQTLTLSESIYLLSNSGIIDYVEVDDENKVVTRAELAEFLAYTPRFERKIEKLINWDIGYEK
ncbi:hypothetical protein DID78_01630 [Candidatus Marinamargulisbacteria bacterium SCGC AG-343-D04]|nr:hypothetical protein DID78_01630 [Candidatus Marinamargulisbacteria bacterium SCGC AG-343-D04]